MADPGMGAAAIEQLLSETRRTLDLMRADRGAEDAPELRGEAEVADGLIQAVVSPDLRLESLQLDPRVMRMDSLTLSEQIIQAVNAAMDNLRAQQPATAGAPDPDALAEQLEQIREDSVRRMAVFSDAMTGVLERLARPER